MPIIDVTLPEGVFDTERKAQLAHDLTHILLKWEGRADNPRSLAGVWAYFNEVKGVSYSVGGKLQTENAAVRYRIWVTVPQGILSDEAKNGLVSEVTQAVLKAEGAPIDLANSLRIYCLIEEVPDGNWGTASRILRLKDMAALVAAS